MESVKNRLNDLYEHKWKWSKIEGVYIEGDKLVPDYNSKIEEYYPFDFFEHSTYTGVDKNGNYSYNIDNSHLLLADFININLENNESVLDFIKKYGFPECDIKFEAEIHKLGDKILNINDNNYSTFLENHWNDLEHFKYKVQELRFIALINLVTQNDIVEIEIFRVIATTGKKLFPHIIYWETFDEEYMEESNIWARSIGVKPIDYPKYLLKIIVGSVLNSTLNHLSTDIYNIRSYIDVEPNTLEYKENWSANNLLTAIYHMFYLSIRQNKELLVCQNESCKKYFYLKNSKDRREKYCCARCGSVQSMRDFRRP